MRRIALVAALLLTGAAAAHADTDHYTNLLKQPRGGEGSLRQRRRCRSRRPARSRDGAMSSAAPR